MPHRKNGALERRNLRVSSDGCASGLIAGSGCNNVFRSTMIFPEDLRILPPWRRVSDLPEQAQHFSAELLSELCPMHILFGLKTRAIANRIDRDDVLFEIVGGPAPLAMVHLSWKRELDPRWPLTKLFASWDEWVRTEMIPAQNEHEE